MRTLLIDADVLAYRAASACEKAVNWGDGYWTWHCDFDEVLAAFDRDLDKIMSDLEASFYTLCLTDSEGNFRRSVYPGYKAHRSNVKKPLVLKALKEHLIYERAAYFKRGLEGDDCMGILATRKGTPGEDRIIVSIDKDMKTIPGLYYNDGKPEEGVVVVTEAEADLKFLKETLTGDTTDGYPGCPGVGPKKAASLIEGADWGMSKFASAKDLFDARWKTVVSTYEKAGLTEDDAIIQARCARILRASDYDFKRKEPILWNP